MKKTRLETGRNFQRRNKEKKTKQLDVDTLYNCYDESVEILHNLTDFLTQEAVLTKSENKAGTVENFVNICDQSNSFMNHEQFLKLRIPLSTVIRQETSQIKSDTNLLMTCDISEKILCQNKEKYFSSPVIKQIYDDFSELESDSSLYEIVVPKYFYKKKILKTYSKIKNQKIFKKDDFLTETKSMQEMPYNFDTIEPSKIDVILSQPVSENLLKLSTHFLKNDLNIKVYGNLQALEEKTIVLDFQYMFNKGNALFFGNLFDLEQIQNCGTKQQFLSDVRRTRNGNQDIEKDEQIFDIDISKNHSEKPFLISEVGNLSYCKHKNLSHIKKDKKVSQQMLNDFDLAELWPDENLLQKMETEEIENNLTQSYEFNTDNTCISKIQPKSVKNIKNSNDLKQEQKCQLINANLQRNCSQISKGFPWFLTASQKRIDISQDAFNKAKKLIECVSTNLLQQ